MSASDVRIALIRAVSPVGKNRVPMPELRAALEAAGFTDVRTWIASGNAVFRDPRQRSRQALETRLETLLVEDIGTTLDVMCRTPDEVRAIIAANPFPDEARERPNKLLATVLKATPEPEKARAFEALAKAPDRCRVIDDVAWMVFTDAQSLKAYTPAAYKRLGCVGTARNWNTLTKMAELAAELERR